MDSTRYGVGGVALTPAPFTSGVAVPGIDLQPGMMIAQYELIRELGHGGMGVVYAARDLRLGRRVAMKFLRTVDREVIDRFLVEAQATAQCNHDNIVIIYEVGEHAGMPYMVLELLDGISLRELMGLFGEGQPMPVSRVIEVMLPVARALARAHELGIVHRDLKPENVIVTTNGQVKVLDFGIAKALGKPDAPRLSAVSAAADLSLTAAGALVGTLPYMSPEQMGVDVVDHRSDLFAIGMMMYEMLVGHHPLDPMTSENLVANLVSREPMRSIRAEAPALPAALVSIVDRCLAKAKLQRLASATELALQLEAATPGRHGRKLADGESPYPGLTAFQEADAERFFGRARDVTRMVARVREHPLTAIVGPSGVGKSSFVRAGVVPALKATGDPWDIITLRPGRHPLTALAGVVEKLAPGTGQRVRVDPVHLGVVLRAYATAHRTNILVFVDQFEELYTVVADAAERRAFTAALTGVADDTGAPLRVVVSMRSDFLDRVTEDAAFMEELSRGMVFLSAPDRDGLREALVAPVEQVGYRFETPAMIDSMLDALAATPGALPLLQFAAAKLWDARDRERRMLTAASFAAIGGVSGALATHADEIVRTMTPEAQALTQRIFRQLVTPERTRAIVEVGELHQLGDRKEVGRVIDLLVAARLLVMRDAGVELVHESLIERWPMLARWLAEDHESAVYLAQLSAAAKQWDAKGRPNGLLWRGDAMDEARRWSIQRVRTLVPRDRAFLDAVLALGSRSRRIRRGAVIGTMVALAAIGAGASIALVKVRAAEQHAASEAEVAQHALDEIRSQERLRIAAEQQRAAAEHGRLAAEGDKDKAVDDKQKAEDEVKQKAAALTLTRDELVAKNKELEGTIAETVRARARAEAASNKASEAAAEAQRARAELAVKLDAEQARVKALEDEKRKLSTKLRE